ncbi:MAG: hypothetical protein ACQEUH_10675, partial [Pseudomonadota bacterium]
MKVVINTMSIVLKYHKDPGVHGQKSRFSHFRTDAVPHSRASPGTVSSPGGPRRQPRPPVRARDG